MFDMSLGEIFIPTWVKHCISFITSKRKQDIYKKQQTLQQQLFSRR